MFTVKVEESVRYVIAVFDDDGDNIRCRWALKNGTIDECGTMCLPPLNVVLHVGHFLLMY